MLLSLFRADGGDDRSVFGDFWFQPISRSASGVSATPETALHLPVVYRCLRVLSGTIASLPRCIRKPKAEGRGREVVRKHPLMRLLCGRANRWQNSFEWLAMMIGHVALRGTGYNRIFVDGKGDITELLPLHPDRMKVEVLTSGAYRYVHTLPDGTPEPLPPGAVFKLTGLQTNGLTGLSVIELGRESIGEGLAQQQYGARFITNDARPGVWIEYPGTFKDKDARKAFLESYQQGLNGANRGKAAVMEGGMKLHELGIKNTDAQFLEGRKDKAIDICRWFGVPPHIAFALEKATNNNIEQLSIEFDRYTLREWVECLEAAIEDQLLTDEERDEGLEFEFDMDSLARGDMEARGEFYNSGIQAGWLMRNEARVREGLDPLPGLDEPLQPMNMVPAGTEPDPEPDPATEPDDAADARARALTFSIAGRVVRKETSAARTAFKRHGHSAEAWRAWMGEFYGGHIAYVRDSLLCATEIAAAWCDRQLCELQDATERDVAAGAAGPVTGETILPLLEAWDHAAAAELAARVGVQMSAQDTTAAAISGLARAIAKQPAPVTNVAVGGSTVNVPTQPAPIVPVTVQGATVHVPPQPAPVVNNHIRGYPLETAEDIERGPDGEILRSVRRVTKE
jgi:HK97 family phage portal protein